MRQIHPLAWAGLIMNCFMALLVTFLSYSTPAAGLSPEEAAVADLLHTMRPILIALVMLQAVALFLISKRSPLGMPAAFISAVLLLPLGAVYLIGALITHNTEKYAAVSPPVKGYDEAKVVFRSGRTARYWLFCASCTAGGMLLFASGNPMGGLLLTGSLIFGIFAARSGGEHPLALYPSGFALLPNLLFPRIFIAYETVREAVLNADKSILFTVKTPEGNVAVPWTLKALREEEQRPAMELLGEELQARGVSLRQTG